LIFFDVVAPLHGRSIGLIATVVVVHHLHLLITHCQTQIHHPSTTTNFNTQVSTSVAFIARFAVAITTLSRHSAINSAHSTPPQPKHIHQLVSYTLYRSPAIATNWPD